MVIACLVVRDLKFHLEAEYRQSIAADLSY